MPGLADTDDGRVLQGVRVRTGGDQPRLRVPVGVVQAPRVRRLLPADGVRAAVRGGSRRVHGCRGRALDSTGLRLFLNKHMKHNRTVSRIALAPTLF